MRGYVLGGGFTGLAAGLASGYEVLEAEPTPGGICCSYYMQPGGRERLPRRPAGGCYRFELGGGHWIFGGDPAVLALLASLAPMRQYVRASSVYFPGPRRYVPYPLQNNLRALDGEIAVRALVEMAQPARPARTLRDWLLESFGPTLCELFFFPFHELYTSALYSEIAPQDAYKSPNSYAGVVQGSVATVAAAGYNTTYSYPVDGLDALARAMAARGRVRFGARVASIDLDARRLVLADGSSLTYDRLISTLPLNQSLALAGLATAGANDPYTSVLVLNVGATRGPSCPGDHWIYVPESAAGFHRVVFYGNVEPSFVPDADRVGLYVERSFRAGEKPAAAAIEAYAQQAVAELAEWGFIGRPEVVDPTWIEVAYTWSWPGSTWRQQALRLLQERGVASVGRYGRWSFQGIADSVRDGLLVGAAARLAPDADGSA